METAALLPWLWALFAPAAASGLSTTPPFVAPTDALNAPPSEHVAASTPPRMLPPSHGPTCLACENRACRSLAPSHLRTCPARIAERAENFRPDALVVLGGGLIAPTEPGCDTAQRAYAALDLWERMDRTPLVVVTGRGPVFRPRALDPIEQRCALTRYRQEAADPRRSYAERTQALARHDVLARAGGESAAPPRAHLSEAEWLCSVLLRAAPEAHRDALIDRMRIEPYANTTLENVRYGARILREAHARRVLVVTTNVYPSPGVLDNHAMRASYSLRLAGSAGARADRWLVGGVSCPFDDVVAPWAFFDGEHRP